MSLSFDGVDDYVVYTPVTLGATWSWLCWFNPTTQGETDGGTLMSLNGGTRSFFAWDGTASSKKLRLTSNRGTDGQWDMTTGFTTLAEWHGVVLTYDSTLTTNDPILYTLDSTGFSILTVGSGLTEASTPVGAEGAEGDLVVGARSTGGNLDFAGLIGGCAAWTSILTANEAEAVLVLGALAVPGMYLYWPMDDTGTAHATDLSGNARTGTVSGAVVGANPPVRPAGRRG